MTGALTFSTPQARRLWADFQRRLDWANRELDLADRADISAEAAAHIRDAMAGLTESDELMRLEASIAGYGELPAAPPAWRRPAAILLHYGSILAIGVIGVFVLVLLHMAVMEVLNAQAVGLWHRPMPTRCWVAGSSRQSSRSARSPRLCSTNYGVSRSLPEV